MTWIHQDFESDAYRKEGVILVIPRGRMVMPHGQTLKNRLSGLFGPQVEQVYFDLADLNFLDSSGLGVLIGFKMLANRHCLRLTLMAPSPRITEILNVAKLDALFEVITSTEAEVVRATVGREEYVLWRDSRDRDAGLNQTEGVFTPAPPGWMQTPPGALDAASENRQPARQQCADAVEYLRQGDYARAAEAYQQALRTDGDNLSVLNNLAIIYEKRSEWYPQAISAWRKLLELSQQRSDARHSERARKHLEALEKLTRAS